MSVTLLKSYPQGTMIVHLRDEMQKSSTKALAGREDHRCQGRLQSLRETKPQAAALVSELTCCSGSLRRKEPGSSSVTHAGQCPSPSPSLLGHSSKTLLQGCSMQTHLGCKELENSRQDSHPLASGNSGHSLGNTKSHRLAGEPNTLVYVQF